MNPIFTRVVTAQRTQNSLTSAKTTDSLSGTDDASADAGSMSSGGNGSVLRALDNDSRQRAMSGNEGGLDSPAVNEESATSRGAGSQPNVASVSAASVNSAIAADTSGLEAAKSALKDNLTELASDPEAFHAALEKSFGGGYDKVEAEVIRQQVLEGDFSWMPAIEVVDESVLQDQSGQQGDGKGLGAYSKDNDTIYISQQLLESDPDKAVQILTEEVGHGLDARLNTSDAAGDEGDIFSRLVGGEEISDAELAELKSENDSGTIIVDGKQVEVEYGLISSLWNGAKDAVKSVGNAITDTVKGAIDTVKDIGETVVNTVKDVANTVWDGVKDVATAIVENELLGKVMAFAQFIPIPFVKAISMGYNLLKAGYAVGMGIKNGSVGGILQGVASLAANAAGVGSALNAPTSFVDAALSVGKVAQTASTAYNVIAEQDFAAAAGYASEAFGGQSTSLGRAFGAAKSVATGVEQYENGDVLGALNSARGAYSGLTAGDGSEVSGGEGSNKDSSESNATASSEASSTGIFSGLIDNIKGSKTYQAISENISTISGIVDSVKDGDIEGASTTFLSNYGEDLGISSSNYESITQWASVIEQVSGTAKAVSDGEYSSAIAQAADMLGIPLTVENQQRLDSAFEIRDSILDKKLADAFRNAATLSNLSGEQGLATNFVNMADWLDNKSDAPIEGNAQAVSKAA